MNLNLSKKFSFTRERDFVIFFILCFSIFLTRCTSHKDGTQTIKEVSIQTKLGEITFLTNECKLQSKVLVFIHGSPGNGSDFTMYLEDEEFQRKYCMIAPDRLGFGNSKLNQFHASVELQSEGIVEMLQKYLEMEKLSFRNATIIGHSYGGPVAFKAGVQLNQWEVMKWKVVLISAPMDPNFEELRYYNHLARLTIFEWLLPKSWIHSNDEMFQLKSDLKNLENELYQNQFPILIIHGDDDGLVPINHIHYFKLKNYRGLVKTYILKNGSHFVPWTRYTEIKNIIISEDIE